MNASSTLIVPEKGISTRRQMLGTLGVATLSASAMAILAGCESSMARSKAAKAADPANDVATLNVALGLEQEGIAAYQLGAESGLLQKPVLATAVMFQSQHKEHASALEATIKKLGGTPVQPKSMDEYAKALNAASLKNQTDVLRLAQKLELGATNAYLGVIPTFSNPDLAKVSGQIAADEVMHWTVLTSALGDHLPAQAFNFG